jgi:uncharacterized protein (TIGR02996 family)
MGTTREALEAALAAEPESVALHSAYADLLIEEGDPRGEYIRLELALEDKSLTVAERLELSGPADSLFLTHRQQWLGRFFRDTPYAKPEWSICQRLNWCRGWLDHVEMKPEPPIMEALIGCPVGKLLRSLVLDGQFDPLADELGITRIFGLLDRLRIRSLTVKDLAFWGDRIPESLLQDEWVIHLTELTLSNCEITDDGACLMAASSKIRNLKTLNLDYNFISPIGISAIAEVGFVIGPQLDNPAWDGGADAD